MPSPSLLISTAKALFPAAQRVLSFVMQSQQQTEWCWSAVATSVSHFFNASSPWTQCQLANAELQQTSCCQNGSTPACNQPWYLDRALARTNNFDHWSAGAAAYPTVAEEVTYGRPLGARIGWAGGGGHFVVLDGWIGPGSVDVQDPWYGHSVYDYNAFISKYQGTGAWTDTYFLKS